MRVELFSRLIRYRRAVVLGALATVSTAAWAYLFLGAGVKDRRRSAHIDFIVVGPRSDPAHITGTHDAVAALKVVASAQAPFVSRGDKSGTDALRTHRLWRVAGIDPAKAGGGSVGRRGRFARERKIPRWQRTSSDT